ncbi:MAG: NUDIX domain-containing protein [Clostridia bacterium]|nr:NUDIX domain-containing protein [Clostridia bacterium]
MEIWDGYNKDGSLAGVDLVRGEPIPDGIYFMTVEILVRHKDGDYLLMKRDEGKPAFPGYLEATAGGAAQKGEDPLTAAYRELREETGIVADRLEPIASMVYRRMINYQYLCVTDCDKDSVTLQRGETVGYKWVTENEFISFIDSGDMIPTQRERYDGYFRSLGYIK